MKFLNWLLRTPPVPVKPPEPNFGTMEFVDGDTYRVHAVTLDKGAVKITGRLYAEEFPHFSHGRELKVWIKGEWKIRDLDGTLVAVGWQDSTFCGTVSAIGDTIDVNISITLGSTNGWFAHQKKVDTLA